ncbi:HDOD domain-containing protein [Shewanella marina]|uniref:HDOD domain-containing protein n=1 Tax=Shewanella marina TaxID=487319 RepID=UPI000470AB5C|nr:HDOD domain-containing protein [Shewanella marina]
MFNQHQLLVLFLKKIQQQDLVLPHLPEITEQILAQATLGFPQQALVDLLEQDACIGHRLITIVNSGLFLVPQGTVSTLEQAVAGAGESHCYNLVLAASIEHSFISTHERVWSIMDDIWQNAITLTAQAGALMIDYQHRHQTELSLSELMLIGLLHNIGSLPILAEVEAATNLFNDEPQLYEMMRKLQQPMSNAVLARISLPSAVVNGIQKWADISYMPDEVSYIDFIRAAAFYSGLLNAGEAKAERLYYYHQRGLAVSIDDWQKQSFLDNYHAIRLCYQ